MTLITYQHGMTTTNAKTCISQHTAQDLPCRYITLFKSSAYRQRFTNLLTGILGSSALWCYNPIQPVSRLCWNTFYVIHCKVKSYAPSNMSIHCYWRKQPNCSKIRPEIQLCHVKLLCEFTVNRCHACIGDLDCVTVTKLKLYVYLIFNLMLRFITGSQDRYEHLTRSGEDELPQYDFDHSLKQKYMCSIAKHDHEISASSQWLYRGQEDGIKMIVSFTSRAKSASMLNNCNFPTKHKNKPRNLQCQGIHE